MKYQNKTNGIIGTVVSEDQKFKTITLSFEDGNERPYSLSTIKRYWKQLPEESHEESKTEDDQYVQEVMQQKKDLGIECPPITEVQIVEESNLVPMPGIEKLAELKEDYCADGRSYAEIGKEIAEQAKQKAKEAKKQKASSKEKKAPKKTSEWVEDAKQYCYDLVTNNGYEIFVPNNIPMRAFKVGGHMYCKFNFSKSSITLAVRSACLDDSVADPHKTINHVFNAVYTFKQELSAGDKKLIQQLLTLAAKQQMDKNSKQKKTKEEK